MNFALGRKPKREDPRTLRLETYLTADTPPPPASCCLYQGIASWPMYRNDSEGDCTCAAAGHMVETWTRGARVPAESDVLALYGLVNGGSDNGAVCLDVLNTWRTTGLGPDKIEAYVALNPKDHDHAKLAVWLFGGVYLGADMPLSAQAQTAAGEVWDISPANAEPGSWGGHCIDVVSYGSLGLTVVTWGQLQRLSWAWWDRYVEEAYAVLAPDVDWRLGGIDHAGLTADLAGVTG